MGQSVVFALIFDVVDSENRTDGVIAFDVTVIGVQINHGKCCLPIVCVKNVGIVVQMTHHLKHGAAELGVAFAVIQLTV